MKLNLPVMLLKESVFLPYTTLKLEFSSESSKNLVDEAEFFHDNHLFIAVQNNSFEESPETTQIASVGVIAKIKQKIELPNGNIRITIEGIERATIFEFLNVNEPEETLESIVIREQKTKIEPPKEEAFINKLYKEIDIYVKKVPYVSNDLLNVIKPLTDLSKMTDVIVSYLSFPPSRIKQYLEEFNPMKRMEMILVDIYKETESYKIEEEVDDRVQEGLDQSQKEYLIREKIKLLKDELGESDFKEQEIQKQLERIKNLSLPVPIREKLEKEIHRYETIPLISPEIGYIHNYIDTVMSIPFGKYTVDNLDLEDVQRKLNASHYALNHVKERIIEYLAAKQMSSKLNSPILCLVGPSGIGKTSLASSIAGALNRSFVKMSVGGMNDESEMIGHRRTYLGASPGKIISLLIRSKSMNPVFLIDEIDKIVKNEKGDPTSVLLDVLDPIQNKYFVDCYIEEEIDLSQVLFITTANDVSSIPEALLDRLEIIPVSGYAEYEKIDIAFQHLIPNICENYGISSTKVDFDKKAITTIIREYTKESGVRELERKLSDIVRKIITGIVMHKKTEERYCIKKQDVYSYLGSPMYPMKRHTKRKQVGVVNGLSYTCHGGDVIKIEANYFKGNGNLILTGTLGKITRESAELAFSYLKANATYFKIPYHIFLENDVHIHIPEGDIPKNGPSAGITITTSLLSTLTGASISSGIAMTGEITLTGSIIAVGNIKEKILGAYKNQIEKVIVPFDNKQEVDSLPNMILENMEIYYVKTYKECYKIWYEEKKNAKVKIEEKIWEKE